MGWLIHAHLGTILAISRYPGLEQFGPSLSKSPWLLSMTVCVRHSGIDKSVILAIVKTTTPESENPYMRIESKQGRLMPKRVDVRGVSALGGTL